MIAFLDCETISPYEPNHADHPEYWIAREMAAASNRGDGPPTDKQVGKFVATSPWLARLVCVGVIVRDKGVARSVEIQTDREAVFTGPEDRIIDGLEHALEGVTQVVTYNGRGFDLPVIANAAVRAGMNVPFAVRMAWQENRYKLDRCFDLADVVTNFGATRRPTFREVCIGLGLGDPKASGDGGDVGDLFRAGKIDDIARYCLSDVQFTRDLYDLLDR